jgi:hypothetical protein
MQIFKLSLSSLRVKEKDMSLYIDKPEHLQMSVIAYLKALEDVRDNLQKLNELGKFIGASPWMELEDAKME